MTKNYKNLARAVHAIKPHLVVTDILHQGPDGIEVVEYVHTQINPEIALVIVSALGSVENVTRGFEVGIRDFIIKPFEPEDFT